MYHVIIVSNLLKGTTLNQDKIIEIINRSKNLNVLYVEDNDDVRNQTTKMLGAFFENIDLANNGKEGFELFSDKSYDLVITDIKMPEIDGMTLIKMIREINDSIPILILSAHDDKDYLLKSIDFNVEGYILKPYNLNQIADTIMKVMERNVEVFSKNSVLLVDDFSWQVENKSLVKNGEKIKLTGNEIKLFDCFIKAPNLSLSYNDIEEAVFEDYNFDNRRVRNLLSRLKKKTDTELFNSVYGFGYELRTLKS